MRQIRGCAKLKSLGMGYAIQASMNENTKPAKLTIKQVKDACKAIGVPCQWKPETREFVVNGYFTDDGQDAIDTAKRMAEHRI
jgi:hypothetical protein